nr:molybdopterin molybdotransferase MoeA [Stenotrophomonas sp. GbtcB23]
MRPLISVEEADAVLRSSTPDVVTEQIALPDAVGRVLAQPVVAEGAQPPFDRVMMDGVATRWQPVMPTALRVVGAQMAGMHGQVLEDAGSCIEVSTGAVLPEGCDCIVPIEQLERAAGGYALRATAVPVAGRFIHRRGSDCAAGTPVLAPGIPIGPPQMALLAANGVARVTVARLPKVAIVATGDELVDVDAALPPGRIRRSNDLALMAALKAAGLGRASLHHLADDPTLLAEALGRLLASHDTLVLSGGVSMGQRDYLPDTLEALGVHCHFHGIAQRPGKPMWFGVGPQGQRVFALPGNPVSSLVCLIRYVRPALLAGMGAAPAAPEQVSLATALPAFALAQFIPVHLRDDGAGNAVAEPVASRNSGDFTALAGTAGVLELVAGSAGQAGQPLRLHRW